MDGIFQRMRNLRLIEWEDIKKEYIIGEGEFAVAWLVSWKRRLAVVKVAKPNDKNSEGIRREMAVAEQASDPSVVRSFGIVQDPPGIVMEYMGAGSLETWAYAQNDAFNSHRPSAPLCVALRLLKEAADGLAHIAAIMIPLSGRSSLLVIHGDVAPRNILLTLVGDAIVGYRVVAKVADFGISRFISKSNTDGDLTINQRSAAPEVLERNQHSQKADVYSWAVMCWEVLHGGAKPYGDWGCQDHRDLARQLRTGKRLERMQSCFGMIPDRMWALMNRCWDLDPVKRPTFAKVAQEMEEIYADSLEEQEGREEPVEGDYPVVNPEEEVCAWISAHDDRKPSGKSRPYSERLSEGEGAPRSESSSSSSSSSLTCEGDELFYPDELRAKRERLEERRRVLLEKHHEQLEEARRKQLQPGQRQEIVETARRLKKLDHRILVRGDSESFTADDLRIKREKLEDRRRELLETYHKQLEEARQKHAEPEHRQKLIETSRRIKELEDRIATRLTTQLLSSVATKQRITDDDLHPLLDEMKTFEDEWTACQQAHDRCADDSKKEQYQQLLDENRSIVMALLTEFLMSHAAGGDGWVLVHEMLEEWRKRS